MGEATIKEVINQILVSFQNLMSLVKETEHSDKVKQVGGVGEDI